MAKHMYKGQQYIKAAKSLCLAERVLLVYGVKAFDNSRPAMQDYCMENFIFGHDVFKNKLANIQLQSYRFFSKLSLKYSNMKLS